jgi:hypothetical protein
VIQSLSIIIHSSAVAAAAVVHAILARQFQKEGGPGYYYFLNFFLFFFSCFVVNDASAHLEFNDILREFVQRWPTNPAHGRRPTKAE